MIEVRFLRSSCRHVGSRYQSQSDQPASTLVCVSSHFERDASLLHGGGALLTAPWMGLGWNRCVPPWPVSRPTSNRCSTQCSSNKPNKHRHARRLQLVWTSQSFEYSRHGEDPNLRRQLRITSRSGVSPSKQRALFWGLEGGVKAIDLGDS